MKTSNHKFTCVIPVYNEKERVGNVLDQIVQVKNLSQIIVVDSASTDGSADFVKQNYPQVELIRMAKTLGKTEAVMEGMKIAQGEYILLFDADLTNVNHDEIDYVLDKIVKNPEIDMVIFSRNTSRLITKLNRFDLIYSGERVLQKKDLIEVFKTKPTKFQLEIAINKYMINNQKNVFYFSSSNVNLPKASKLGKFSGLIEDLKMLKQVFSYSPRNYLLQALFFCQKKLF